MTGKGNIWKTAKRERKRERILKTKSINRGEKLLRKRNNNTKQIREVEEKWTKKGEIWKIGKRNKERQTEW